MRGPHRLFASLVLFALLASAAVAHAITVPANFAVDDAAPGAGFNTPTAIAFLPDGRFFVAEKRGRVYEVRNGVKRTTPIWSGENEVITNGDRGLLGIAVDPRYYVNHYIYLYYVVDPDSNGTDTNPFAFSRLTRYTVNFTDSATVIASSRTILFGTRWSDGPVSCSDSHTCGALRWGRDGSLLMTQGDGAHYEYMDAGGHDGAAFGTGLTDPFQDIGSFRAQDITNMSGKVLRLNPANGRGYASNPFANGNLASIQSRVWAYGFRNAFRFCVKPGTGSTDTTAGNPGTLVLGDVGWNTWEEADVCATGGQNFGWPCYEGFNRQTSYQSASPAHNDCGSVGTPSNPSSFTAPFSAWNHSSSVQSTPPGYYGNAAIGGVFYSGTQYPSAYRQYFFADFGQNWIRVATFDVNDNLVGVASFATSADGPVDFATDPVSGDVYYVAINAQVVRRIRYTGASGGNNPPVAAVSANPLSGQAPLTVAFSSAGSSDPNGDPLTYSWVFGDGSGSTAANPSHVFTSSGTFAVQLTVSDGRGGTDVKFVTITVTVPTVAFPSTPVRDNFNRANGAIGSQWTDMTTGFTIAANQLAPAAAAPYIEWGSAFGPDQEAFFTMAAIATGSGEHNLVLKVQGTSWTDGLLEVGYAGGTIFVSTLTPGVGWQSWATLPLALSSGDRLGARALGDGTVMVFRNGTQVLATSVAGWPFAASGGRIGIQVDGAAAARFDDFGGGNVATGNTKPVVSIVTPANNAFFHDGQAVLLKASGTDAQSPADSLDFEWVVDLYHNNHVHPAVFSATGDTTTMIGSNHDDGTGVHLQVKLTASDPQGAISDTAKATLWPEVDLTASAVTVSPNPPTAGQSAQWSFALNNGGRMPAPYSRWVLRAGGNVIAQGDTIVPAQSSLPLTITAPAPAAGSYTLRLVADSLNSVFETNEANNASLRSLTVNPAAGNVAPVAVATGTPQSGTAPLTVSFSGAASTDANNDSLTFAWAFGDGGTATGRLASRTYAAAGTYAAVLTVNDGKGGTDTASVAITVTAPAGTFPTTSVRDDFNRANGSPADGTHPWVAVQGTMAINANVLQATTTAPEYVWNQSQPADQEAFVTLAGTFPASGYAEVLFKVQGTTATAQRADVYYDFAAKSVTVETYNGSSWTTRGTAAVTFVTGDRLGVRARANGSVEVYRNATLVTTVGITGWAPFANAGLIGVGATNSTQRLDNFGGGAYVTGPANTPPVAVATGAPKTGTAPLAVSFSGAQSTDANNDSLTFAWVFGDGGTATGRLASHTYANAGNYAAVLTVNDGRGGTDTASVAIAVSAVTNTPPVAVATGTPTSGQAPLTVNFSGAQSTDANNDSLTFAWAFGDGGTATGRLASRTYANAGSYAAVLTVNDGRGGTDTASVAISVSGVPNTPPVAAATGAPTSGQAPLTVNFSGAQSTDANNDSLTFAWAFGDGGTATGRLASHVYSSAGSYAAVLTVSDGRGGSDTASVALSVAPPPPDTPPVARATGTPQSGVAPLAVSFSGAQSTDADNDSLTFGWAFGDGGTATGRLASHTYTNGGAYAAVLTVSDGRGGTDTASVAISVTPNTPPVAVATGAPQSGTAPLTVNFSGAPSSDANGDSLTFGWAFGDGGTATGRLASHTYAAAGSYAAVLTVTDGRGGSDTASVAIGVTPATGAYPANAVLDNFNRADGTPIDATHPWVAIKGTMSIAANVLRASGGNPEYAWNAVFGADQEAYVTVGGTFPASGNVELMFKAQGTTTSSQRAVLNYDFKNKRVTVETYNGSAWTTRGTASVTLVTGDRVGLRARANGTVEVYRNTSLLTTVSITAWAPYAGGGRIGLGSSNSTARLDNFGGGDFAPALVAGQAAPLAHQPAGPVAPAALALSAPVPNPSRTGIAMSLTLPTPSIVDFAVLDVQGRDVWHETAAQEAGRWSILWDGRGADGPVPTGMYLARVRVGTTTLLRRFAIVR